MGAKTSELTWASVALDNPEEMELFLRQEESKADQRIREAVEKLQSKGILDDPGGSGKPGTSP